MSWGEAIAPAQGRAVIDVRGDVPFHSNACVSSASRGRSRGPVCVPSRSEAHRLGGRSGGQSQAAQLARGRWIRLTLRCPLTGTVLAASSRLDHRNGSLGTRRSSARAATSEAPLMHGQILNRLGALSRCLLAQLPLKCYLFLTYLSKGTLYRTFDEVLRDFL